MTGSEDEDFGADKFVDLHLEAERIDVPDASHWGLILTRPALNQLRAAVLAWLGRVAALEGAA